jgi:phospholipid-translocating ATPase
MYLGIFDQDVNEKVSFGVPNLYFEGIRQTSYNTDKFWVSVSEGLYQSIICYYVMYLSFYDSDPDPHAKEVSKDAMGTFLAHSVILTINTVAIFSLSSWTWLAWSFYFLTICVWLAYAIGYSYDSQSYTYGVTSIVTYNPSYYLGILFCIILCILPRITFKYIQQYFWPTDLDIIRELQKKTMRKLFLFY